MAKKAILFVDDEPNILSGIKRMLRSMRKDYDFHFAEGGGEALELMDKNQVDVVVSDMRMPGMDGADFLTEVQSLHPQAVRIMLTGQADGESVLRTVSVVHQFLAKPCEPNKLKEVLVRSGALHDLMTNTQLKEVISGVGSLPSLPSVYAKLQEALNDPDVIVDDIAIIIEQDIAMTAKLLQLVNSSFFGLFQAVESPARAVKLLGLDTIKILALGVQIFDEMNLDSSILSFDYLWNHSFIVAQFSKLIASHATDDSKMINDCFIAGMVHDIGRLLLISKMGETYLPLLEAAKINGSSLFSEEINLYNSSHGGIGAYLIGLWGFNADIIEAVAFHNNIGDYPADTFSAALAVHVADALYYQHYQNQLPGKTAELNGEYLEKTGFSDSIDAWSDLCNKIIEDNDDDA